MSARLAAEREFVSRLAVEVLRCLGDGRTLSKPPFLLNAADQAGVGRKTVMHWMENRVAISLEMRAFATAVRRVQANWKELAFAFLVQSDKTTSVSAQHVAWMLRKLDPILCSDAAEKMQIEAHLAEVSDPVAEAQPPTTATTPLDDLQKMLETPEEAPPREAMQ